MAKQAAAEVGHNSGELSEANRKVLFHMHRQDYLAAIAAKKAADAAVKQVGKLVKAELGEHGMLQIKAYEQAHTAEGKAQLQAKQQAEREAMAWAGTPINTQLDIFSDLAPLVDRARADGEDAGMRGETLNNPHASGTAAHTAYDEAWHAGQEAIFAIRKVRKEAEVRAKADELLKGDDGVDEDDADPFAPPESEAA